MIGRHFRSMFNFWKTCSIVIRFSSGFANEEVFNVSDGEQSKNGVEEGKAWGGVLGLHLTACRPTRKP